MRPFARNRTLALAVIVGAVLATSACRKAASDEHVVDEPVTIEHPDGSDIARLTLTADAADRLDIRTATVKKSRTGLSVPSAAVIVDPEGAEWVYTSPEPLVFVRASIDIDREAGAVAFLTDGPPVGTEVVTVGVPELYGAEYEVGH
jgi:hypothetical protein